MYKNKIIERASQVKGQKLEVRVQEPKTREYSISSLYPLPFTLVMIAALTLLLFSCAQDNTQNPDDFDKVWTDHVPTGTDANGESSSVERLSEKVSESSSAVSSSGTVPKSSSAVSSSGTVPKSSAAVSSSATVPKSSAAVSSSATVPKSSAAVSSSATVPKSSAVVSSSGATPTSSAAGTSSASATHGTPGYPLVYDGQTYKTVVIGNQTWMAENLNYATASGSYCDLNTADYCATYGRVYDWATAQTVCPAGWHLPTDVEWRTLEITLGMNATIAAYSGGRETDQEGAKLKANSSLWSINTGTNTSGFSALPGGASSGDSFSGVGSCALFWTATERNSMGWYRALYRASTEVTSNGTDKIYGYSVRCIKDSN